MVPSRKLCNWEDATDPRSSSCRPCRIFLTIVAVLRPEVVRFWLTDIDKLVSNVCTKTYSHNVLDRRGSLSRSTSVTLPPRTAALRVARHFRTRRAFSCQSSPDTGPTEPHGQNTRGCMSCNMLFCKPLSAIIAVTAKIARKARRTRQSPLPTFFFHKMNRQRCGSQRSHFQQRLPQLQVDKLSFDLCSAVNAVGQIGAVGMNVQPWLCTWWQKRMEC